MTLDEHLEEALGLASASDIWPLSQCPGKRILIRSLREQGLLREIQNPDATIGERIHAALDLEGEPESLERKESEIRDDCERLANRSANQFFPEGYKQVFYEQRFWYAIAGTPFFSAKPDRLYKTKNRLLDVNFKTGRGEETPSYLNLQLRCEVAVIKHKWISLEEIGVAILQPMVTNLPEIAIYDEKTMREATIEVLGIVDKSNWDETRKAGSWCKYCAGRAYCPEASQLAIHHPITINIAALPEGLEGAEFLSRINAAPDIIKALKEAYKAKVMADAGCIPGWRISKGRKSKKWTNIHKVIELIEQQDIDVTRVVDIPFGKLEDELARVWGVKGRDLKRRFDEAFSEVIKTSVSEGWLERIPANQLEDKIA